MSFVYSASEPDLFKNLYEGSDEVIIGKVVSARLTEGQLNQHAIILEVDADQLILNSRCTTSQDKNRLVEVRMQGSVNIVPVGEKGIFFTRKIDNKFNGVLFRSNYFRIDTTGEVDDLGRLISQNHMFDYINMKGYVFSNLEKTKLFSSSKVLGRESLKVEMHNFLRVEKLVSFLISDKSFRLCSKQEN